MKNTFLQNLIPHSVKIFCMSSAWYDEPSQSNFFFLQIILSNSVRTFLLSPNPHTDSIIIMVVFTALQKFIDRILDTIRKYFPKTSNKTQWHKIITKLYGLHCTICCKHRGNHLLTSFGHLQASLCLIGVCISVWKPSKLFLADNTFVYRPY